MLNAAMTYHLTQNDSEVAHDILRNLYVDNLVSGCHTEQAAVDYFLKSRSLLNNANFNLRSWTSNSSCLMSTAREHNVAEGSNPVNFGTVSHLVMSKTRAAPVKQHSLPRLELMAAVTAARLCLYIRTSLNATFSVCLWSDSQIVLAWIYSKKSFKPFVSHRVNEIRSISTIWRYCPSVDNPADLLTRGITYKALYSSALWKYGPKWLSSLSQWPVWQQSDILHVQITDEELEVIQETTTIITVPVDILSLIDISRFNSLSRLLSTTAYVL